MRPVQRTSWPIVALLVLAGLVAFGTIPATAVASGTPAPLPTSVHSTTPEHIAVVNADAGSTRDLLTTLRRLTPGSVLFLGALAALLFAAGACSKLRPGTVPVVSRRSGALPGRRAPPRFAS